MPTYGSIRRGTYRGRGTEAQRAYRAGKKFAGAKWSRARRKITFRRGRDRVGGYYGRFNRGLGKEQKFIDFDTDDAVIGQVGVITDSVNLIPQNVTESGRIGRKCTLTQISWKYEVFLEEATDDATPPNSDVVRILVYLDKQCNGAAATALGIWETDDYQSFNNLANTSRFVTLMDRTHTINRPTLTSTQNADTFDSCFKVQSYTWYKKCNIPLEFSGVTGALTELRSNNVGILVISKSGAAGINGKFRIRFSG